MSLRAGAAVRDITPKKPLFLAGYPHVPRISAGVHDPLLASSLYLHDGTTSLLFIAVDIIYISLASVELCRTAISERTRIPPANILISANHTHSGPITNAVLAWKGDPIVPPPDAEYMVQFHAGIIDSGIAAAKVAEPARLAVTAATASGVGGNRINPKGPFDSEVGLLAIHRKSDSRVIAISLIYGMHPTVLHEDSKLVSSDFPHFTRQEIGAAYPGAVILYHLGPCGNLSTRYHARGQTFAEAERLGRLLGRQVSDALALLKDSDFRDDQLLNVAQSRVELVPNTFPTISAAETALHKARQNYDELVRQSAAHGLIRTAECVVFGCEEALTLAQAQTAGEVVKCQEQYGRAEVQAFRIGNLCVVGLPGEEFVEYSLEIKRRASTRTFVISLANGELQGYIVTPEAAAANGYEAAFSLFRPESGARLVNESIRLVQQLMQ